MIIDQKRRQEKIIFLPDSTPPTVPTAPDHTTLGWLLTDIYKGEICFSKFGNRYRMYSRDEDGIFEIPRFADLMNVDADVKSVKAMSTATLTGSPVYDNGTGGVGATLIRTGNGALPNIDGVNLNVGDDFAYNHGNQIYRGIYKVTVKGSASEPYVATRRDDSDETSELNAQIVSPSAGSQRGQLFSQTTVNPIPGTSNIVYSTSIPATSVTKQTPNVASNRQIPWWNSVLRQLSNGIADFIMDTSNKLHVGVDKFRVNSADGDIEKIKSLSYDFPAAHKLGYLKNDASGNLTWDDEPILHAKVSLTAAQIKTLNSLSVEIVAAPGAGKFIDPLSVCAFLNNGTEVFQNTTLIIGCNGIDIQNFPLFTIGLFLNDAEIASPIIAKLQPSSNIKHNIRDNEPLYATAEADSATGDGTLDIYIQYRIITM